MSTKNDAIFTVCTPNEIKVIGEKIPKRLTIILFKVPKLITDNDEKHRLIKVYHDYPITEGTAEKKIT